MLLTFSLRENNLSASSMYNLSWLLSNLVLSACVLVSAPGTMSLAELMLLEHTPSSVRHDMAPGSVTYVKQFLCLLDKLTINHHYLPSFLFFLSHFFTCTVVFLPSFYLSPNFLMGMHQVMGSLKLQFIFSTGAIQLF